VQDTERFLDAVGRRISEVREEAGFTQAQVAERLGTTVSNYQRIEHGLQNTTLGMIFRIANIVKVAPMQLLAPPKRRRRKPGRPKRS
jgi:transcriptional regulator with XRE-family HTH domain